MFDKFKWEMYFDMLPWKKFPRTEREFLLDKLHTNFF